SSAGVNLLAARHLATPLAPVPPADVPQPAGGSDRNAIPLYDFGRVKVVKHYVAQAPLRTSALRTLGGYANVLALASVLHGLAARAAAASRSPRTRISPATARSSPTSPSIAAVAACGSRGSWPRWMPARS